MKIINKKENKNLFAMSAVVKVCFTLFLAVSAVMCLPLPAGASPLQGLYDSCNVGSGSCLAHLDKMGDGGFNLVLDYNSGSSGNSAAEMRAYLDRAQKNGIQVIWDFNELAGKPNAADTVAGVVGAIKDHPALWGYCIGDETSSNKAASVREMSDAIKAVDSSHRIFIMGGYNTESLTTFANYADVLGLYTYPIGENEDSENMVAEVGSVAKELKQFNSARGKKTIMALQAFNWANQGGAPDWSNKRWPTRTEVRQMHDQALASDPIAILWFSYGHAAGESNHWNDLIWAANGK